MNLYKDGVIEEINIAEFDTVKIGHAQDNENMTGVTVLLFDKKAIAGIDISGGGPASRETPLLDPQKACDNIHAIVLSGGSAFGLEAGSGVAKYLEEHGIGFETGYAKVPLVCQSCIYDLSIGSASVRPDIKMGYDACENARVGNQVCGIVGAGTGATVGKLTTMRRSMKSGLGIYACKVGNLKMAAIVVVNALGDIFDYDTKEKIAGMLNHDRTDFADIETEMYRGIQVGFHSGETEEKQYASNTTIGVIITNGKFSKADMNKIASMTRNAYARCINPVGTTADGDTIYAVSAGEIEAEINTAGILAARTMGEAIKRAIIQSRMDDEKYLEKCL